MTNLEQISRWNRDLSKAIAALGTPQFFPCLIEAISHQVRVDYPQVWLYRRNVPPQLLYHEIPPSALASQVDEYLDGPYQEDPFYQTSMQQPRSKIYRLSRVALGKLEETNYYTDYYAHTGTVDEVVYLTNLGEGIVINLCVMRLPHQGPFTDDEYEALYLLAEPVSELLKTQSQHRKFAAEHLIQPGIDHQINQAFKTFGSSLLSPREKDVLELMLRGYGTDTSAARLDIAVETVRRHRKSIYRKLDVSSQTDLFSLFLNAMSCVGEAGSRDPLSIYMAPR
ncbi:helix-turn-helix transcriptional regulator [Halioglobus japonicus]|uniref:LuxR family transcriptional regulator n=1 Tax=Halioglobus japonicus TaxID=930805 RepID=A0AAP8MBI7_9GAMM|nr:LuxR C-terminal-related transcriptional regulator [Halioglobus japonicus]AQA20001.1 helix-turn-helix transcriptional regulator [Halioglobus japonicus]PLW84619.1 LuxR family transcriptional regulator [Halioglobus japonicus]GHD22746.1 helix-turn-helix transcriptional regulator [Halioglobus japonicus]